MMQSLSMARPALQLSRQSLFPSFPGVSSLQANSFNTKQTAQQGPSVIMEPQIPTISSSTVAENIT